MSTPPPPPPPPPPPVDKASPQAPGSDARTTFLVWAVIATLFGSMVYFWMSAGEEYKILPYYDPDFVEMVEAGRVEKVEIVTESSGRLLVKGIRKPLPDEDPAAPFRFGVYCRQKEDTLEKFLKEHGVGYKYVEQNPYVAGFLSNVLPLLLVLGIGYLVFSRFMKRAEGGALSFGKSRAKLLSRDTRKVTFERVAGIEEAKEEVQEIINFLKDPKKFEKLGGRIPHGVLLVGPPGTGKTLLAKAIAGEADVPFFCISGSDFEDTFVGVGASRVRDMFDQGRKSAPCIIFIDEIDSVGRSRHAKMQTRYDDQTLNQLLAEMDGFETSEGVIIIAATNRPDVLDRALMRPGRFDRQIVLDLPTLEGRIEILKVHVAKVKLAPDADLRRIARGTPGFSGADLANLINEAALIAARQDKESVDNADLDEARDKVLWGRERKSRKTDEADRKITAYHEAGHAVVNVLTPESDPLHKVTIIPRGMALGGTMFLPEKDITHVSRRKLLGNLAISMGGRAAEEVFLGDICTGARQDLKEATALARAMVCDWGMSDALGPRTFGANDEMTPLFGRAANDYSDDTAKRIDAEVTRLLAEAHQAARALLENHRAQTETLVAALLEHETVDGPAAESIIRPLPPPSPPI
ncbi:MAG: ATP-dependent zinc metalloprotease FtsH [Kiritimatiellaeota bacterium]|nr:ATP-dependent zinc metalloprotease FtsH [Kiritimatiellota bacterium]